MRKSPELVKIESLLRSDHLVAQGFLGDDTRSLPEIVEADLAELTILGYTIPQVAARMHHLSDLAFAKMGQSIIIDNDLEVSIEDNRGSLVCPWPDGEHCLKTVTIARRLSLRREIRWSALALHLIEAHSFFQGLGSPYRLDPQTLVRIIF